MKQYIKKYLFLALSSVLLNGCVTSVIQDVEEKVQTNRKGPRELPIRNITDFSDGLRCIDEAFINFGFSENAYVMLLEEITDKTKKVNAGTREMLISAISDMTRRSRAIQVIAYGNESGNLVSFLSAAEQNSVYQNIPPYDIIGAISQLDKDIVRKQADLGGQVGGTINESVAGGGFGVSASNSASVLGLDLSVVTTHNIAVLPGVTTRNSVVLYKSGKGGAIDAGISKTGVNYSVSSDNSDGNAQGLRALVELSIVELIGKLTKIPYWNCLGLDPEHESIKREVSDWHYQLVQSQAIHTEMKVHLYLRGYYNGPIDEVIDQEYQLAVLEYKKRLGLPQTPDADLDFYRAFLNDTPTSIPASRLAYIKKQKKKKVKRDSSYRIASKQEQPVKKQTTQENIDLPLSLLINSTNVKDYYAPGEDVFLTIKSNRDGYVNCYIESGDVYAKIFPNRFSADGFISKNGLITLPDSPSYSITSDIDGESVHCLLTTQKIQTDLPGELRLPDFEALPIQSASEIFNAYEAATTNKYAKSTYIIRVQ